MAAAGCLRLSGCERYFPTQAEWDGDDGGHYILCFVFLKTQYVVLTSRSSFYTLCLAFAFCTTYGVLFLFLFYM